jgi:hypothetical protein
MHSARANNSQAGFGYSFGDVRRYPPHIIKRTLQYKRHDRAARSSLWAYEVKIRVNRFRVPGCTIPSLRGLSLSNL